METSPKAIIIMMTKVVWINHNVVFVSIQFQTFSILLSSTRRFVPFRFQIMKSRKENNDHVTFYVLSWCEVELEGCWNVGILFQLYSALTLKRKRSFWMRRWVFKVPRQTFKKNHLIWHTTSAANCSTSTSTPTTKLPCCATEIERILNFYVYSIETDTERALKIIKISEFTIIGFIKHSHLWKFN